MKNQEFKNFLKALVIVLTGLLTIIASAGAIGAGSLYAFAGFVNLGWMYFPIREAVKYFKERNASGNASKGAASKPAQEDSKDIAEQKTFNQD